MARRWWWKSFNISQVSGIFIDISVFKNAWQYLAKWYEDAIKYFGGFITHDWGKIIIKSRKWLFFLSTDQIEISKCIYKFYHLKEFVKLFNCMLLFRSHRHLIFSHNWKEDFNLNASFCGINPVNILIEKKKKKS